MTRDVDIMPPDGDEVRAALARLRAFPDFAHSPRLVGFLDYIVGEALAGRGDDLRAYTIATSVFERGANFDAHSNSIVRVEATRLRKAIRNYYDTDGRDDPVRIEVPLGGYVPRFSRNGALMVAPVLEPVVYSPAAPSPPPVEVPPPVALAVAARQSRAPWSNAMIGAGVAIAGVAFLLGTRVVGSNAAPPARLAIATPAPVDQDTRRNATLPVVAINSIQVGGEDLDALAMAGQLQQELASAIGRFDGVTVLRGFSRQDRHGSAQAPDYEMQGHVEAVANRQIETTFRLVRGGDHRAVWSGAFNLPASGFDARARDMLVRAIATPVAQPFGAIFGDLRAHLGSGSPVGRGPECLARFEEFWEERAEPKRRAAHDCLVAAVAGDPDGFMFPVLLANLYLAEYLGELPKLGTKAPLDAAEDLANRAVHRAPGRAHPWLALSQVYNLRGNYEMALHLAEHARDLNPYDTDIMAGVGAISILRGRLDSGANLLRQALENNPAYPGWANFYLFIDAWQRGDRVAIKSALGGIGTSHEPDAAFARIIATAEMGDIEQAKSLLAAFRANHPTFAAAPRVGLERLTLAPDLVDRMMVAMKKIEN